jgi:hypothetical protein
MPGRRRNLEIKAVDPDPQATVRAALELGAGDEGWLDQRDTYVHAVQGRVKLREASLEPAELIAYARAELAGPKVSLYRIVQVADHNALIEALSESLGIKVVVEKARRLFALAQRAHPPRPCRGTARDARHRRRGPRRPRLGRPARPSRRERGAAPRLTTRGRRAISSRSSYSPVALPGQAVSDAGVIVQGRCVHADHRTIRCPDT